VVLRKECVNFVGWRGGGVFCRIGVFVEWCFVQVVEGVFCRNVCGDDGGSVTRW